MYFFWQLVSFNCDVLRVFFVSNYKINTLAVPKVKKIKIIVKSVCFSFTSLLNFELPSLLIIGENNVRFVMRKSVFFVNLKGSLWVKNVLSFLTVLDEIDVQFIFITSSPTPAKRLTYSMLDKSIIKSNFGTDIKKWEECLKTVIFVLS